MSDNKYIIDKDSLTGLADAVRNKLGAGEATTDPQTGDIVYPEDKGYYLKENLIAKITGFGWSQRGYSGNFAQDHSPLINDENWNEAVGEPWYSVEITLVKGKGNFYDMDVSYTGGSQNFTNVTSSTYTVSAPNGSTYFNLRFSNKYNPNVSYGSASLESLVAVFKDAEGKPIRPKQSSYHCLWKTSQNNRKFGTGEVETPIPFSIDDIQNKITNYLVGKKSTIKTKLFLRRKSSSTTETDYGEYSNYLQITSTYNYNVGTSDPSYITTKIPNLRPENILYMSVISSNSNEHFYEFRPQNNAMEHYTSLTQTGTGGKRLSTATDYYFFPNGSELKSAASTYGILAHWDRNNLILDLQSVSKTNGTIDGEITANFSAYINPYSFYIVYKEA